MKLEITRDSVEALFQRKGVRVVTKTLLVVVLTSLSTFFFGFCLPFFCLAFEILPSLGVGGVVYLFFGGVFGLLFGGISSTVSLARSTGLVTPYTKVLFSALCILVVAFVVSWATMTERFSHV